jgi:membrane protein
VRESPDAADEREGRDIARRARELRARFEPTFGGRCVERIIELRPLERGLGLASRAFIALLPLIIVASSLTPAARSGGFAQGLIDRFGLTGQGASSVQRLFATPDQVRGGTTILEIIVLIYAVVSFARLLARTYELAWRLPPLGVRGAFRGLIWVGAVVGYVGLLLPLRRVVTDHTGVVLADMTALAVSVAVWLFTPYVLLGGRVRWLTLVPTGVLTALALGITSLVGKLYLSRDMTTSAERYGLVGVAFVIVTWLVVVSVVILVAAAIGAVAGERWLSSEPAEEPPASEQQQPA